MSDIRALSQSQEFSHGFQIPRRGLAPLAIALDGLTLFAAGALAQGGGHLSRLDVEAALVASFALWLMGRLRGLYSFQTLACPGRARALLWIAVLPGAAVLGALLLVPPDLAARSRSVEGLFALYAMTGAPLARLGLGWVVRAAQAGGRLGGRRVVLIGDPAEFDLLAREDRERFGFDETARVALSFPAPVEEAHARLALAVRLARAGRAEEFALLLPWPHAQRIEAALVALRASPLGVRLYPDAGTRALLSRGAASPADPYLSIQLRGPPLGALDRATKRAFDLTVAALVLMAFAPAMLVLGLVVRATSPGPAIFKQTRRGFDGREFKIWKFRTMNVAEDGPALRQAMRGDPRVTRLGRWLRRTSLDELPQLVNVIRGEMSLIGPRPHALAHDEAYGAAIGEYALRRHVKPGLTGAAQAEGLRGETCTLADMRARVARDLWYIDNWSLWLDVRIALRTLRALVRYEAY